MSTGDCICPREELTFEGLIVSCVCSLVDLTVSPVTWNNITGCYPKSLFPWSDPSWAVLIEPLCGQ